MARILLIALGGAFGAILRFAVSTLSTRLLPASFPYGTLAVNLAGCFAIGALWTLSERFAWNPNTAAFLFVGLLGAFTTFSTYAFEAFALARSGHVVQAGAYVAASTGLGLLFVALGMAFARS